MTGHFLFVVFAVVGPITAISFACLVLCAAFGPFEDED